MGTWLMNADLSIKVLARVVAHAFFLQLTRPVANPCKVSRADQEILLCQRRGPH